MPLRNLFSKSYRTVSAVQAAALTDGGAILARDGRDVSNLAGGMRAWARADLPVVARGGGAGRVS